MIFKIKIDFDYWDLWTIVVVVGLVLLVNAAIYSAIGFGVYHFFQWLGGQL